LPQVITADMLRARKAQGRERSLDEIEIPAELLIGLDEEVETAEEWEEEEDTRKKGRVPAKAKGKSKPVKKPAKPEPKSKGKKWRPAQDDDFGGRF
jgi:hypothetical protein